MLNILGIVPARGGSKGFPRKNMARLDGHPLIAYAIEAGRRSKYINQLVISSDDDEILEHGSYYGAQPLVRSTEASSDDASDLDVILEVLRHLKQEQPDFDLVVWLRPTSPLRPLRLVDMAIEMLVKNRHATSIRTITEAPATPFKMWWHHQATNTIQPLMPSGDQDKPRQKLPQVYWQTGHVDVIPLFTIYEDRSICGSQPMGIRIPQVYAVDIDNERDLKAAEMRMERITNLVRLEKEPWQA